MDDSGSLVRQVRKLRSAAEKRLIVEQTFQPGASSVRVARSHGLNANVVFHWRREYRDGKLAAAGLVPVVVTGDVLPERQRLSDSTSSIRIDLPGGAVISVEGTADLALIQATAGTVSLSHAQLSMLLEGIDWVRRITEKEIEGASPLR